MDKLEIDKELIRLGDLLSKKELEYNNIQFQQEELEASLYILGDEITDINYMLRKLEKDLVTIEIESVNNELTGDEFIDSFIKCSYFCNKYDNRNDLSCVSIKEDRLIALDGYKGIIIKCGSIPKELKNSYIRWDTREDFENNIEKDMSSCVHSHLMNFIDDGKSEVIIKGNLKGILESIRYKTIDGRIEVLNYNNIKVGFNQKYLDLLYLVFSNEKVSVYYPKNSLNPLIVEDENKQVVILPIRLGDSCYV